MVLALLKRVIFDRLSFTPNTLNTYRQLPRSPTSPDLERGSTSSSSSLNSNNDHNTSHTEKNPSPPPQSSPPPSSSTSTPSLPFDPRIVSSATIGLSDGLTVPFALTAGLSTLGSAKVVIYGGLAELCAGAISMGLGGYLGAVSEIDAQTALSTQTHDLITSRPSEAHALLHETLLPLRLPPVLHNTLTAHLSDPTRTETLHHLLMALHHHAEPEPSPSSPARRSQYKYAYLSALTISLGYFLGGFVPLLPYIFLSSPSSTPHSSSDPPNPNPNTANNITTAFWISVAVTALCLLSFGYAKVWIVGERRTGKCVVGAVQMLVLGGAAAGAAVGCVWGFGGRE
ncbi:MAG: hypothetical protein Q9160_003926 [Pyrenula sp. 1 TL-2023]